MITANFHDPERASVDDHTGAANPFVTLEVRAEDGSRVAFFLPADRLAAAEAAADAINAAIGVKP